MSMNISVELVPRDEESLRHELAETARYGQKVNAINIPDLLRYDMRSWQGAKIARDFFANVIPHIRAMDIDLNKPLPMKNYLDKYNIPAILVIEGDPPQNMRHETFPTVSTDVIRRFREEMPNITIYAGIDQYRGSLKDEYTRMIRKKQAGATGFFSQPFFSLDFARIYADMVHSLNAEMFWGISPVLGMASQSYWERKNNVIFPQNFAPTMEWNVAFAREMMDFARQDNANVYIMPIKTEVDDYLSQIL